MEESEKALAMDISCNYDPEMQVACVEYTIDPGSVDKEDFKKYMQSLVGAKEVFESGRVDLDEAYNHPVNVVGFVSAPTEEKAQYIIDRQTYSDGDKCILNIPGAKLIRFGEKDGTKEISYEKTLKKYESTNDRNNSCMNFYQEESMYINDEIYKRSVSKEETEIINPNNRTIEKDNSYYREDGTLSRSENHVKTIIQEKGINTLEATIRDFDESGSCTKATKWEQTSEKNEKIVAIPGFQVTLTQEKHAKVGNKYKDVDISVMNQTTGQTIEGTLREDDYIASRLLNNCQMAVNNVGINIDIMEEIDEIGNIKLQ